MADEAKRRVSQTTEGELVILQGVYLSSDPSLSNKDVYPLLLSQDGKLKVISDVESFPSDLLSGNSIAVSASKTIIDGCESTNGWSAQDQATSLATSVTHTHGTKSLSFAKSGTTGTTGYIDKTITAIDLDVYQTHSILHLNLYISDTSDIVKTFIRIGTDSSNYFQYDHLVADMAAGWNDTDHILTRPTSQTGSGADLSSITYIAYGIELNANSDTLSGILVDNITVKRMIEVLSFAGVAIPPAVRNVVITDRNSNKRADVEADGAQYALYIMSNSLASESTLESIKDTDGIKKITDALPAGTNNIGDVDLASALPAGTNNIGDVDIASALPAGTNNIGDVDIASAIPAGTSMIGAVQDAGVSYTPVNKPGNYGAAQTDTVVWDPAAGKAIVLLGVFLSTDTAMNIQIESADVDVIPPAYFAANGGMWGNSGSPIWKGAADATLTITSSAAGNHSVLLWGYEV